jgi:hypothetical protein
MKNNRSANNWQKAADALFLPGWRKFLAVGVLWAAAVAATWALFGLLDVFFSVLTGANVVEIVRQVLADGQRTGLAGGVLPALVFWVGAVIIPLYLLAALVYTIVRTQAPRRYLQLSWHTLLLIPAFVVGVFLHNFVYAMFFPYFVVTGGDEAVFFLAALIGIPLYLLVVIVNTVMHFISGKGAGVAGTH